MVYSCDGHLASVLPHDVGECLSVLPEEEADVVPAPAFSRPILEEEADVVPAPAFSRPILEEAADVEGSFWEENLLHAANAPDQHHQLCVVMLILF